LTAQGVTAIRMGRPTRRIVPLHAGPFPKSGDAMPGNGYGMGSFDDREWKRLVPQGWGRIMEVRLENKKAAPLTGIQPVLATIEQRLHSEPQSWLKQLQAQPGSFA